MGEGGGHRHTKWDMGNNLDNLGKAQEEARKKNIDSPLFKNSLKFLKYSPTTEGHNLTRDPHATSLIIENVTFADHV